MKILCFNDSTYRAQGQVLKLPSLRPDLFSFLVNGFEGLLADKEFKKILCFKDFTYSRKAIYATPLNMGAFAFFLANSLE